MKKKSIARSGIDVCDYRVEPDTKVRLGKWPTRIAPLYDSDKDYEERLAASKRQLSEQQQLLYAHDRYALLLIFQAMDAAGKDGAIRHVMSGVNPQGCQVFSFKHPSAQELDHDFLWRTHLALPERGRIGIFNRSYYEEVLIVKVQPEILQAQGLPESALVDKRFWQGRYRSIVESESHLHRNGTRILKFFLHLSREEQRQRFIARIDDPDKHWKFNLADITQRAAWDEYMKAYEACIGATSTHDAPWHIIPADDKKNARLIISHTIVEALASLKLSYPSVSAQQRKTLQTVRRKLAADKEQ
jgi:PPK2 family polyphosphate:nucleotide phosphotransferase